MKKSDSKKFVLLLAGLFVLAVGIVFLSLSMGIAEIDLRSADSKFILFQIRLPRILLAFLVGGILSAVGAALQALLRNPLADPHLLGVSGGGALGVVIGSGFIISGTLNLSIPFLSILGSLTAMVMIYRLSLRKGALSIYTLILIGVMMNSFFVSTIIFIQSLMRSDELMTVLFWMLGNLSFTGYPRLIAVGTICLLGVIPLLLESKRLNILSLGESAAHALGVQVEKTKKRIFIYAALLTGMVVSVSGMIGFVGLVVPHLARLLFGQDYRKILPGSLLMGGIILMLSDLLARLIIAPEELPVGVVTSFLGVPFFIYLLKQRESKKVI